MRTFVPSIALICLATIAVPAFAIDLENDVTWFVFPEWDHSSVTGSGQTFNDVIPGVNATVEGLGDFTLASKTKASDQIIVSGHATPGSNTFTFTLSASLPLVIQYYTVDDQEEFSVAAASPMANTELLGASPDVTNLGALISLVGTDHGVPTSDQGASAGYITAGTDNSLIVTHEGTRNNKFESFRIGALTVVPEPTLGTVAWLCVPMLMLRRRGIVA